MPVAEMFQKRYGMQAGNVIGTGSYIPSYVPPDPRPACRRTSTPFWMVGGTGAEVEVDTETGHVRDHAGWSTSPTPARPINPRIVETQLSGAAIMQLGFTMFEKMEFDGGQVTNASLADYKIPGILDMPPTWRTRLVEAEQANGPFGAKGVGESGTFGVSPAIANAIEDAVGVRLTELPLTAEAVLRALRAKEEDPGTIRPSDRAITFRLLVTCAVQAFEAPAAIITRTGPRATPALRPDRPGNSAHGRNESRASSGRVARATATAGVAGSSPAAMARAANSRACRPACRSPWWRPDRRGFASRDRPAARRRCRGR